MLGGCGTPVFGPFVGPNTSTPQHLNTLAKRVDMALSEQALAEIEAYKAKYPQSRSALHVLPRLFWHVFRAPLPLSHCSRMPVQGPVPPPHVPAHLDEESTRCGKASPHRLMILQATPAATASGPFGQSSKSSVPSFRRPSSQTS